MFKSLLWLPFALWINAGFAQSAIQNKVTGMVTDSSSKPVSSATVTLSEKSKTIATTATNETGSFRFRKLNPGKYTLTVSNATYNSEQLVITLLPGQPELHLDTIRLSIQKALLGTVTVTAQKGLVEDKGDRLVYNAEKDISNAGGTAADVLRKVPNLTVDLNGNVQMRGNSNIKVLINGKPSAMMARNLADALRQMPANVIKLVEVITSPGAKYDAEGSAGVINIITKKGLQGFNGSVNATAGNFNRGLGTNLNLNKKKIGLSVTANMYQNRNQSEGNSVRTALLNGIPLNVLIQSNTALNTGTGGYGEMSFDYDPDSVNHINFAANIWGGSFPDNTQIQNRLNDAAGNKLQGYLNDSHFKNPYGNGQLDLGYTRTFKKPEQEFSLLTQFSRMPDNYFYNTDRYELDTLVYRQKSTNYSRNKEYTIQADYTQPFSIKRRKDTTSLRLETGIKAIIRNIGSEYRVEQSLDGTDHYDPDPSGSNDFNYKQRVYSMYTSLRVNTKHKWSLNAGARLEHTTIHGNFLTTQTSVSNEYNNLIPSITLSKGFGIQTLKISYTQRITRPLIWYLNPWLNQSDPKNISTGNPNLNSELNHAMELSHSLSTRNGFSLNTALYWRRTNNAIEYLSTVDVSGVSLSRPQNIANRKAYGMNINLSGKPNKKWNLNGGGDLRYVDMKSIALAQRNSGFVWNLNLNSTYALPKDLTIQANGSLSSGWINLQRKNSGFYWYGVSAKRMFWDKKASLNLGVNNPFNRGVLQKSHQFAPTYLSESEFLYVTRSVRLTFEWRFGQMGSGSSRQAKKISNDDKGR